MTYADALHPPGVSVRLDTHRRTLTIHVDAVTLEALGIVPGAGGSVDVTRFGGVAGVSESLQILLRGGGEP